VLLGRESCFKIVKFEDSEERSIMWAVRRLPQCGLCAGCLDRPMRPQSVIVVTIIRAIHAVSRAAGAAGVGRVSAGSAGRWGSGTVAGTAPACRAPGCR